MHGVRCHLPFRRLVLLLPAVVVPSVDVQPTLPPFVRSPVRHRVRTRDDLDRANRAAYMREWQANAKRQRMEARNAARRSPRQSPRLANSLV